MTEVLRQTMLHALHIKSGARMMVFNGWEMPLHYQDGIFQEHLTTRYKAGLFDIGHMGSIAIKGKDALSLIQYVTTNNASAMQVGQSQYTILADEHGGAIDDAYLFRFFEDGYLLVVNAANHKKDLQYLIAASKTYEDAIIEDISHTRSLLSLQGPLSEQILSKIIGRNHLPAARRNALSVVRNQAQELWIARTGYTGEPICFELFIPIEKVTALWQELIAQGAYPIGLGARDTLRLEAGLPLYGHELGNTLKGESIPVFSNSSARFAVNFSPEKGNYIGRSELENQFRDLKSQVKGAQGPWPYLPNRIRLLQILDKGIARTGAPVYWEGREAGYVTSGTMVPYWLFQGAEASATIPSQYNRRAIAMALIDSDIHNLDIVQIEIQGKSAQAVLMPYLLRNDSQPFLRPIFPDMLIPNFSTLG